ncbi:hypothetical protein, partial [Microcoleus sp. herbarium5]|uniref:hypothetical protein n=1 Tax=Microcoleus sp. herbarium5 TaxID=3055434 RepID=UPI002FD0B44D
DAAASSPLRVCSLLRLLDTAVFSNIGTVWGRAWGMGHGAWDCPAYLINLQSAVVENQTSKI